MFDPAHKLIDLKGVETVLTSSPIRKLSERQTRSLINGFFIGMSLMGVLGLVFIRSLLHSKTILCKSCNAEISINGRKINFVGGTYHLNPIWNTYELEYKKQGKSRKWTIYPHDVSTDSGTVSFKKDEISISVKNEEITNREN